MAEEKHALPIVPVWISSESNQSVGSDEELYSERSVNQEEIPQIVIDQLASLRPEDNEGIESPASGTLRRPSAFAKVQISKTLTRQQTVKPQYRTVDFLAGILTTFTIIASTAAAIYLLYTRSDCENEEFDYTIILYSVALFMAFIIRWGTFLARWTHFAQKNLSLERYFLNKSFVSLFYTLHLMPLVMIDENWDHINPIFDDKSNLLIRVPIILLILYALLIILWVILWLIGRKLEVEQYKNFAEVLEKVFRALTWILCVLAIFTIFVICSAILSEIFLVYIELFSSFYYLVRCFIAAYTSNRLCCKYISDDKKNDYQDAMKVRKLESQKDAEQLKTQPVHQDSLMAQYRSLAVKPSISPVSIAELEKANKD